MLDRFKSILTSFRGSIASKSEEDRREALESLLDALKDAANFTAADSEDDCVRQAQFTKTLSTLMGIVTPKPEDDAGTLRDIHHYLHQTILNEQLVAPASRPALRHFLGALATNISELGNRNRRSAQPAPPKSKLDEPLTPPPKKVPKRTELADNIRVSIANVPDIKVRIDQTKSYENDNGYSIEKDPRAREPEEVLDALSDAVDEQRAWLKETIKDESVRVKQLENTLREYMQNAEAQLDEISRLTKLCAQLAQENATLKREKADTNAVLEQVIMQLQRDQEEQQRQQIQQQTGQANLDKLDGNDDDDIDLNADPTDIEMSHTKASPAAPAQSVLAPPPTRSLLMSSIAQPTASPVVPQLDLTTAASLLSLIQQSPLLALAQLQPGAAAAAGLASQQQHSTVSPRLERKSSSKKRKRSSSSSSSLSSSESSDHDDRKKERGTHRADSDKHKSRKSSSKRSPKKEKRPKRSKSRRRSVSSSDADSSSEDEHSGPAVAPPPRSRTAPSSSSSSSLAKNSSLNGLDDIQITFSNTAALPRKNIKDRIK